MVWPIWNILGLVLACGLLAVGGVDGDVTVQTNNGPIRGQKRSVNGIKIYEYLGIPYAKPPVESLRFRRPVPVESWTEIRNATHFRPACFQRRGNIPNVSWGLGNEGDDRCSEDCLYLNIWTPKTITSNKSVMFWIHGGSWRIGGASLPVYDGAALAAMEDIIIVTANYRLGSLGFLYAGNDTSVQGNMGLHDIKAAINWVHANIAKFGGNPDSITLFGESVGGTAASYFAMSTSMQGKIKRIICESGVANWPFPMDNNVGPATFECIARNASCWVANNKEASITCLQGKAAVEVVNAEMSCFPTHLFTLMPVTGDEVIAQNPSTSVLNGNFITGIDILVGTNHNEGLIIPFVNLPGSQDVEISPDAATAESLMRGFYSGFPPSVVESILKFYNQSDILKMMSDGFGHFMLNCPAQYFAENTGSRFNTYFYHFDYRMSRLNFPRWVGATHTTELPLVFGVPFTNYSCSDEKDRFVSKSMMHMFANFAKTGNPDPENNSWPKFVSPQEERYLLIRRNGNLTVKDGVPFRSGCEFWRPYIAPQ